MYARQTLLRPSRQPCASPGQSHGDLYSACITAVFISAERVLHVSLASKGCVPEANAAAPDRPLFQVKRNLKKIVYIIVISKLVFKALFVHSDHRTRIRKSRRIGTK